jgi:hypothetical protein
VTDVTLGVNAYISAEDAFALSSDRLFANAWNAASPDLRARALITATALLDRMKWKGRPLAPSQPLAWPRVNDHCPEGYPLTAEVPREIITASVELAIYLLSVGENPGGPAIMQRMLGDSMVMHFAHVSDDVPKHVRRLIEPFLRVCSTNVAEVSF